jgi:hypothetical protein
VAGTHLGAGDRPRRIAEIQTLRHGLSTIALSITAAFMMMLSTSEYVRIDDYATLFCVSFKIQEVRIVMVQWPRFQTPLVVERLRDLTRLAPPFCVFPKDGRRCPGRP